VTDQPGPTTGRAPLDFGGVTLEALSGDPTPAVAGLGLHVDDAGLTISGPGPGRLVTWPELSGVRLGEPATLADATPAVGLRATVGPRWVRWLIPADQLPPGRRAELDRVLAGHSRRPPGSSPAPDVARPPTLTARRGRRRVLALVAVVVVLVGAGAVLAVALTRPDRGAGSAPPGHSGDHEVAQQINISANDLPSTWSVDPSTGGPLGAFFSSQGAEPTLSAGQRRALSEVASGYERCMGIGAAADRIFGHAGSAPTAQANSPVFAAPTAGPIVETGSQTQVFSSTAAVAADRTQVSNARFPQCFGSALGTEFLVGAQSGTGASFGTPQVQPLALPETPGVATVGIDLTIPITSGAVTVSTQFGFVLAGGGRVEATLITFAAATVFPAPLTDSLTAALEHNIAVRGTATGA